MFRFADDSISRLNPQINFQDLLENMELPDDLLKTSGMDPKQMHRIQILSVALVAETHCIARESIYRWPTSLMPIKFHQNSHELESIFLEFRRIATDLQGFIADHYSALRNAKDGPPLIPDHDLASLLELGSALSHLRSGVISSLFDDFKSLSSTALYLKRRFGPLKYESTNSCLVNLVWDRLREKIPKLLKLFHT
jgi:hypothetical protein